MIHDEGFRSRSINTVYFTGASVPLTMAIGLGARGAAQPADPLPRAVPDRVLPPVVTPFVVVGDLWKWLYNGDYGLFNYYLFKAHLIDQPLLWLSDKNLAMPAVILMSVWAGIGFSMVDLPRPGCRRSRRSCTSPRGWTVRAPGATALHHGPDAAADDAVPPGDRDHRLVPGLHPDLRHDQRRAGHKTTTMVYLHVLRAFKYYDMGYASTLAFALFA